jgi:hypothetical protein
MDDVEFVQEPAGDKDKFFGLSSDDDLRDALDFNLLLAAAKISGTVPILYVNEPIYIEGNNPVRYNDRYPRWAYNQYRDILRDISNEHSWTYLDMWDLLPSNEFSDTVFHRTVEGESRFTQEIIPAIQVEACRK